MDGYVAEHNCRLNRTGGGVSLYIKNEIEYSIRKDLLLQNSSLESLFIEIDKKHFKKKKDIVVGVFYRPPDTNIRVFNNYLLECLDAIKGEKKTAYLLGDFNVNILNSDNHLPTREFVDSLFSHSFIPKITKPTRVTNRSATLIDNIFSNVPPDSECDLSGILYTDISDHFPVFYIDNSNLFNIPKK